MIIQGNALAPLLTDGRVVRLDPIGPWPVGAARRRAEAMQQDLRNWSAGTR